MPAFPTCTEACEQLGPLGPALVFALMAVLNWLRAREAQRRAQQLAEEAVSAKLEATKHAAHAERLREEVASLRPKSNPELAPVVIPPPAPVPRESVVPGEPGEKE